MMPAKSLMSSMARQVARNTRQVSTSSNLMKKYQVQSVEEFKDKVMNGGRKPVLVNFTAPWCGPCKELEPRLEAAIKNACVKVDIAKVDIEALPEIAMEHLYIKRVPTLMAFKKGKFADTLIRHDLEKDDMLEYFIAQLSDDPLWRDVHKMPRNGGLSG